ncbi:TIGR04283 family arsenosugar biosynthesis glycosyltransferase [Stieleria sp. JC731]|uniref:TIGR04283 family arsenosugar biosynthesis glycosyltransferase n=1 Tax=Pirellulaceae TaxID=2691357 RepID=UPI001E49ABA2|nr:TIGR04283 family arsenosugar biosynthesis glycosyltransferase [Stieleria sp. JC731]
MIPALNEEANIAKAIRSAHDNGVRNVIVADGGSTDNTITLAQSHQAVVVHTQPGRGLQLAHAARLSNAPMLLFLHADNWLETDCVEQLCRHANGCTNLGHTDQSLWGGFRQRIDEAGISYRLLESGNAMRIRLRGLPFGDQAMFVDRKLYQSVGGFQTNPLMEDVVLSQALRRRSWPVLIDACVHVDARRWKKRGIVRQTLRNWGIQTAHFLGVRERQLHRWYR